MRLAVISGYAPPVHACANCGAFSTEKMYFDCESGLLYCSDCGDAQNLPEIGEAVVSAMRHIVYSPFDRLFAFTLSDQSLRTLTRMTQTYLQNCMQTRFSVLDYFWTSYS
jgi:DNA repair protein RecO (recombination protein O)